MRLALRIVLSAIAVFLCYLLIESIMRPIRFVEAKDARYAATIKRLKDIRTAQEAYRSVYQRYTGNFDTLIHFLRTDSFRVVRQIGSFDDSAAVAEKRVFRDTITVCVRDSLFRHHAIDSLRYVPYGGGAEFELAADTLRTGSKVVIQVFQAQVSNRTLLRGLDPQEIVNLDDLAKQLDRYPGLRVGSLTEATNNAGNWE